MYQARDFVELGLVADEVNRAAHGTCAIDRALRPAQHFDAVDVEEARLGCPGGVDIENVDRYFVEIDAGGRRSRLRTDAADLDVRLPGAAEACKRKIGHRSGQLGIV